MELTQVKRGMLLGRRNGGMPAWISHRGPQQRGLVLVLLVAAAVASFAFGLRSYHSFRLLHSAYEAGAPVTSSVRPWMTLRYVSTAYRVPAPELLRRLGLPGDADLDLTLKAVAERASVPRLEYVARVQSALAGPVPSAAGSRQADGSRSAFAALADDVLGALQTYGYPVLAVTLVLGSLGLPLPDGIAAALAGALAQEGRMSWMAAAAVIFAASARRARVEALFARWGGAAIFVTRTFASYLSSIASLAAGAARLRVLEFLLVTMLGRAVWTAAYLGLGYAVGADLEAAASFLANLAGCFLALLLLAGSAFAVRAIPTTPREVA
jgi:membrane protein DedA with SNARE-associated domain